MHRCLRLLEVLHEIAEHLLIIGAPRDLVNLAITDKSFTSTVLEVLWKQQKYLDTLLKCFPTDLWHVSGDNIIPRKLVSYKL